MTKQGHSVIPHFMSEIFSVGMCGILSYYMTLDVYPRYHTGGWGVQNEYRHLSFSSTCKFKFIVHHSVLGTRATLEGDGASAHPIQGRGVGEVEPIPAVIGQLFMFTFTPVVNLESAIILMSLDCGKCTWRELKETWEEHANIQTQDFLTVRWHC